MFEDETRLLPKATLNAKQQNVTIKG